MSKTSEKNTKTTKKVKKVVTISLDGILRNIVPTLENSYKAAFKRRNIKPPVNPFNIRESLEFETDEEYQEFINSEALSIFGRASEQYKGVCQEFNRLTYLLKKNGYRPILKSLEISRTKLGTMFFLANSGVEIDEIQFISNKEEYWDDTDILITSNPEVIAMRPPKKRVLMLRRAYNRNVKYIKSFTALRDIPAILGFEWDPVDEAELAKPITTFENTQLVQVISAN